MPFSNLIGNPQAKLQLQKLLQSAKGSTLLFFGPEGIGKSVFALKFAETLMGKDHRILAGNHPDLHYYRPEGKSEMHSMASMQALIEEMSFPPFEAPCKVFIIEDAERMQKTSSNALLKTFEEPKEDSILILVSSKPDRLLSTITSRCRKVIFFPLTEEEIRAHKKCDDRISYLAQGSLTRADLLLKEKQQKIWDLLNEICDQIKAYHRLLPLLVKIEDLISSDEEVAANQEIDLMLDQLLYLYRKTPSFERILENISHCHFALQQHIKVRVVLEWFFLKIFYTQETSEER